MDLVPAQLPGISSVSPHAINEAGMVPCVKRMWDGMARDRCVEKQMRGCRCALSGAVAEAHKLALWWEFEEERRAEARKELPSTAKGRPTRYPPWKLKCHFRGCKKDFFFPRRWGKKPNYCCWAHKVLEHNARRREGAEVAP